MAVLVLPIALTLLIFVIWRGIKNRNFVEGLPLFIIQLNSVYVWTCVIFLQIGWHKYGNCYQQHIKGNAFAQGAVFNLLFGSLNLEPLNLFLYTWRFLDTLEREETNKTRKKMYHWFARISIWIFPFIFLALFCNTVIFYGKYTESVNPQCGAPVMIDKYYNLAYSMLKGIGVFSTILNCLSCVIMILIVRFFKN